jgi:putative nucleotidyltransferase with HDIG domain
MNQKFQFHIKTLITSLTVILISLLLKIPHYYYVPVIFIIVLMFSSRRTNAYTKPLKRLEEIMKKISTGDFNARVPIIGSENFFYNVNKAFNQILDSFTALLNVSESLGRERDLDKLLNLVITETTKNLDAERTTLFLYNHETKELWSYIAQDLEIKEIRMPLGKGVAGYVAKTGKVVNIKDAYSDERFDRDYDQFTGFRTRNLLCAPMRNNKNELIGVIQVLNKIGEEHFTEYDETLLSAITNEAAIAIENTGLYDSQEKLLNSTMRALATTIDARDPVTKGHSDRVARYAVAIGKRLNLSAPDLKTLEYAALLHDVGKISIPDEILSKPGVYSIEEREEMKKHAASTKEILEKIYFPDDQKQIPLIASSHHEKLDGSGYPSGLKNKDIPLLSRILVVVDIYDAFVSYDRPYKPPFSIEEALRMLKEDTANGRLDETIVNLFINNKLYELEKREFIRISANLSIEFRVLGPEDWRNIMPLVARTKNISAKGLLFRTEAAIPINAYIEVRIHLPNFTVDVLAKALRKIQTKDGYEVGIAFLNLSENARHELNQHLTSI